MVGDKTCERARCTRVLSLSLDGRRAGGVRVRACAFCLNRLLVFPSCTSFSHPPKLATCPSTCPSELGPRTKIYGVFRNSLRLHFVGWAKFCQHWTGLANPGPRDKASWLCKSLAWSAATAFLHVSLRTVVMLQSQSGVLQQSPLATGSKSWALWPCTQVVCRPTSPGHASLPVSVPVL